MLSVGSASTTASCSAVPAPLEPVGLHADRVALAPGEPAARAHRNRYSAGQRRRDRPRGEVASLLRITAQEDPLRARFLFGR